MRTRQQHNIEAKTLRYAGIQAQLTKEGSLIIRCKTEKEKQETISYYTKKGFNVVARFNGKNTSIN